jgi:hypothetical protein
MTSPSDYGLGYGGMPYGGGPYGGPAHGSTDHAAELSGQVFLNGPPYLISANPALGQSSVAVNAPVSFVLGVHTGIGVDPSTLQVVLDNKVAIFNGIFAVGFAGTIIPGVGGSITVNITTHPPFAHSTIVVFIDVKSF